MVRAVKFAKIDFIKLWPFSYMLLFPIIATMIGNREPGALAISGVFYCLFASIILAAMPFKVEHAAESGFLQLLPAKPGEQVLGHFLCGLVANLAGFTLGMLCAFASHACNPAAALFMLEGRSIAGLYPALLGLSLVFTGAQALMMTVLRYHSVHIDNLMRTVPGFIFLIGIHRFAESTPDIAGMILGLSGIGGLVALVLGVLVFAVLACIGRGISASRGQS